MLAVFVDLKNGEMEMFVFPNSDFFKVPRFRLFSWMLLFKTWFSEDTWSGCMKTEVHLFKLIGGKLARITLFHRPFHFKNTLKEGRQQHIISLESEREILSHPLPEMLTHSEMNQLAVTPKPL